MATENSSGRVKKPIFTKEMKETHTILVPDMLPIHFNLILAVFRQYGYKMELLQTSTATRVSSRKPIQTVHRRRRPKAHAQRLAPVSSPTATV